MLHRNARRDFSVEIKSASRRNASLIPAREPKAAARRTQADALASPSTEAPAEPLPHVKPASTGRVLPNLIVPEAPEAPEAPVEAAPEPKTGPETEPKTRRPYTRRAKPAPAAIVATPSPTAEPAPIPSEMPVVAKPARVPSDRQRGSDRNTGQPLALGQRWKRRLSRWSR